MSDLKQNLKRLSDEQRARLQALLLSDRSQGKPTDTIQRRQTTGPCPLSVTQQRLWFIDQWHPGSAVYNVPSLLRLEGLLNVPALEQALNALIERHETLRTSITLQQGEPQQRIASELELSLPIVEVKSADVDSAIEAEVNKSFNLQTGPLIRSLLLRLDSRTHILLLTLHHIISDGWSRELLCNELAQLYNAHCHGSPASLTPLPVQYADYAIWQHDRLKGDTLQQLITYWRDQLAELPRLELPADQPRTAHPTHQGAQLSCHLPAQTAEGLQTFSQQHGVTLYMVLMAAFKLLLQRHCGQDDIAIGVPIAGRIRPELEGLIGFFVNTLVLRTSLNGNPGFHELLGRVRQTALDAYQHQELPFDKLVETLQPERQLGRNPLFEVMFNYLDRSRQTTPWEGLDCQPMAFEEADAKFELSLYAYKTPTGIQLKLVYQQQLFSHEYMSALLDQYQYLLTQILAEPESPIDGFSLVTPQARMQLPDLSVELSQPALPPVTELIAGWAQRHPQRSAIRQDGKEWSYQQLMARAAELARLLRAQDLKPGDVVAITGWRSFGLIASIVATLLGGQVFLLLDPQLPARRRQVMIKESQASCLLVIGREQPAACDTELTRTCMVIDPATGFPQSAKPGQSATNDPLSSPRPDDPAYIIFTSGSLGVPKAVLGSHQGLSHFLNWQCNAFKIGPGDRTAQLIGFSFDAILRDIFIPLTSGGLLCLPDGPGIVSPDTVLPWLERERITVLHTVPALAQFWLAHTRDDVQLPAMRWAFIAGEPLQDSLVRQWRAFFTGGSGDIVNLYGPTETTMSKCCYRVPANPLPGVQPIGHSLPGTQVLIYAGQRRCGVGEPGEIVIRTPYRTLGYLNRPEETQKCFRNNPCNSDDPMDLLYFTGDIGCHHPDGTLRIHGRVDDQVKIRGIRIAPAEVAASLSTHPGIKACYVTATDNTDNQPQLVAYVVAATPDRVTGNDLRHYLFDRLPAAMVPDHFIQLERLPLNPNGKVDRHALPPPTSDSIALNDQFEEPRTPVEQMLSEIWTEVLGIERVGVNDNFFDLGGHSLLAMQVITRLLDRFELQLSLQTLFAGPTIRELGVAIVRELAHEAQLIESDY